MYDSKLDFRTHPHEPLAVFPLEEIDQVYTKEVKKYDLIKARYPGEVEKYGHHMLHVVVIQLFRPYQQIPGLIWHYQYQDMQVVEGLITPYVKSVERQNREREQGQDLNNGLVHIVFVHYSDVRIN